MRTTKLAIEKAFERQTSKYKPRTAFRPNIALVFRRRLNAENRSMVWIHKERHDEIDRLAEVTGLTLSTVTDTLLRFALNNIVVVTDEGKDIELNAQGILKSGLSIQELV